MKKKVRLCVICEKPIPVSEGLGYSAEPLSNGTCCGSCYRKEVIPLKQPKSVALIKEKQSECKSI